MTLSPIRVFFGQPIETRSERVFLRALISELETAGQEAVILANFHLNGRQIDFVIATAAAISVVEVKSSHLPIKGEINGLWRRQGVSGDWAPYPNPYAQALSQRDRLRDALGKRIALGAYYPAAFVTYTTPFPLGSAVTKGDFKVQVQQLADTVRDVSSLNNGNSIPLDELASFALALGLTRTTPEAAINAAFDLDVARTLESYRHAFKTEYAAAAEQWIAESAEQTASLDGAAQSGLGCFIKGPSGCGKTLAAKSLAIAFTDANHNCLFIAGKDFNGSWSEALKRETALLVDDHHANLLRTLVLSALPLYIILDGLNEIPPSLIESALRGLRALARRYDARLVVTSQLEAPPQLAGLECVSIQAPSDELKIKIATAPQNALAPAAMATLRQLKSGLEARIIGEIGADLQTETSRAALIDQYIRRRLTPTERVGALGLRRFAARLHDLLAFSMSEIDFDEFMLGHGVSPGECDQIFASGLLVKRRGRVSFSHEMHQNACTAFGLAKAVEADLARFNGLLDTPLLSPLSGDIISLVESTDVCRTLLGGTTNAELLLDAADGTLGPLARKVSNDLLDKTAADLLFDIQTSELKFVEIGESLQLDWNDTRQWTAQGKARLSVIGQRAGLGYNVDQYFALCRAMDERLDAELRRLRPPPKSPGYRLNSNAFMLAYYGMTGSHGFTVVARSTSTAFSRRRRQPFPNISLQLLSSGQLHFILETRAWITSSQSDNDLARDVLSVFQTRWEAEPYHVQLALLNIVGWIREADSEILAELTEVIGSLDAEPGNWGISSSIIDALGILGALDNDAEAQRPAIEQEVCDILVAPEDDETFDKALGLYAATFDHPYSSAYCEVFNTLPFQDQHELKRRAFQAPKAYNSMSLRFLAEDLASLDDPKDAQLFARFAGLPSDNNPFSQDEMTMFLLAVRLLARNHIGLPSADTTLPKSQAMAAIRDVIYAVEANDASEDILCQNAWAVLSSLRPQLVVGCLSETVYPLQERSWIAKERGLPPLDLLALYPQNILDICRRFAAESQPAESYHQVPHPETMLGFAFQVLGKYGDRSDLDLLRSMSRAHPFAKNALMAIRAIETATPPAIGPIRSS